MRDCERYHDLPAVAFFDNRRKVRQCGHVVEGREVVRPKDTVEFGVRTPLNCRILEHGEDKCLQE